MQYSDKIQLLQSEGAFEVLARVKKLEATGKKIIHLQIGEPDFDTPPNICDAAIAGIKAGKTHYSASAGVMEARQAAAEYINKTRNISVTAENVVILPGAKTGIFGGLLATINAGDEVIIPNPGYPTYESIIRYLGARPVHMSLYEENDFRFKAEELKKLVTPKTKMIVINSPQNPTGGVLTAEDLETIYQLAKDNDHWILSDEIYSRILYDTEFVSVASIPGALERTILCEGMSKTYAMTGWRLGYVVVPTKLADYLFKLAINNYSSTNTFIQDALIEALTGPQNAIDEMVKEFTKRRKVIVEGLNDIEGISCLYPKGAFYAFANIKDTGLTSEQFAELMLEKAGVACLAGTAFGASGEGYARFSYANSVENIQLALSQMKSTLASVKASY